MTEDFFLDEMRARIVVCGIGVLGLEVLGRIAAPLGEDVFLMGMDADEAALAQSAAATRVCLGSASDGDAIQAAAATYEQRAVLEKSFEGADLIFILADLGSGVGCGATPVAASLATKKHALTLAFVVMPSAAGNKIAIEEAQLALEALDKQADAVVVVYEDALSEYREKRGSRDGELYTPGGIFAQGVQAFSFLITRPSIIAIDFADIRTLMEGKGRAFIGIGRASGEKRATDAAEQANDFPMLGRSNLAQATCCLVHIRGGRDILMKEIKESIDVVKDATDRQCKFIFGVTVDEEEQEEIRVTVIAAGMNRV